MEPQPRLHRRTFICHTDVSSVAEPARQRLGFAGGSLRMFNQKETLLPHWESADSLSAAGAPERQYKLRKGLTHTFLVMVIVVVQKHRAQHSPNTGFPQNSQKLTNHIKLTLFFKIQNKSNLAGGSSGDFCLHIFLMLINFSTPANLTV